VVYNQRWQLGLQYELPEPGFGTSPMSATAHNIEISRNLKRNPQPVLSTSPTVTMQNQLHEREGRQSVLRPDPGHDLIAAATRLRGKVEPPLCVFSGLSNDHHQGYRGITPCRQACRSAFRPGYTLAGKLHLLKFMAATDI